NQLLQPQRTRVSARPQHIPVPDEITIRQKPRITVNTTPATLYQIQTQTTGKFAGSTARPNYRDSLQTNPPATTYRPAIQFFTQKPAQITFSKPSQVDSNKPTNFGTTRRPVDFAAEFQKFQQENNIVTTTTATPSRIANQKTYNSQTQGIELPNVTQNPIYETQLVFDPRTGQIDSSLFPQNVAYRIPAAYVPSQQQPFNPSPQVVTIEQLQQQNQPVYQRPLQPPTTRSPLQLQQFSQQVI
ncbi:uncharacterized protein LOC129570832, partial [Sitodiplosis mosellana]|uniref:uncharacterized protein LOC129570832 n=1 Tax=Sitodiplosis mosellana TaxID=263140 RepID=UPI002444EFCB